jgi:NAD-dependent SIR2 family protein deacetylase
MTEYKKIRDWLNAAKSMVITAGAGMGVDSGLPDFRGKDGQWGVLEAEFGRSVLDIANPKLFIENPKHAWKIYASRLIEYTNTEAHAGFQILRKWIKQFELDYFILTSNVDNQFQKAGFSQSKIRELHGSIFYLQCSVPCSDKIWRHTINLETVLADIETGSFPLCPNCGSISRPNVYMFRDAEYLPQRSNEQKARFRDFLKSDNKQPIIVFEIGSGPHVQTIRQKTRMLGIHYNAKIVRINPENSRIKEPHIGISKGALEALSRIDDFIEK